MKPDVQSMELSDEESIERLLNLSGRVNRRRRDQGPMAVQRGSRSARRRCSCGHCRTCHDNARWERIFESKFADPDYYRLRLCRMSSPLA